MYNYNTKAIRSLTEAKPQIDAKRTKASKLSKPTVKVEAAELLSYSSRKSLVGKYSISPEQSLWCMVLLQALEDFLTRSKKKDNIRAKLQASSWIFFDNEEFHLVCEYSEIDPAKFREFALMKQKLL